MTAFTISSAVSKDGDRLYSIECACFSVPWSREAISALIANTGHTVCLTVRGTHKQPEETASPKSDPDDGEVSKQVIGYVGVLYVLDEGEITNIAVDPAFRGQGAGYALLKAAQDFCRSEGIHTLHLEVRPSNIHAIALYLKCGFTQSGMRRGYYGDNGEDALLYSWKDV